MRALSVFFLCALSTAACGSGAPVRAAVSLESENSVRIAASQQQPLRPVALAALPGQPAPGEDPAACDPNYRPCVPIARDVDCLGGGGDGPAYVRGPVRVIRRDIYRLDHDRDGIGCE